MCLVSINAIVTSDVGNQLNVYCIKTAKTVFHPTFIFPFSWRKKINDRKYDDFRTLTAVFCNHFNLFIPFFLFITH